MKLLKDYPGIQETMYYLLCQVKESIPYAKQNIPSWLSSPEGLFRYLKMNVSYKLDLPDREQLQTMQTLFENNIHRIPGAGDCDCFVITATASAIALGLPVSIVLVGRSKSDPVHIYNIIGGQVFDLTNTYIGEERYYPYKQIIPIR